MNLISFIAQPRRARRYVAAMLALGFALGAPAALAASAVQRNAVAKGPYELAYSAKQDAVYVASSGGFGDDAGPAQVLQLDPKTLAVKATIPLQRKAFGVVLDDANDRLYVGNTVDTSVTVVDTAQGKELGVVQLMEKKVGKDGKAGYTHDLRELVVDGASNRLYVTGHSGEGSVLFVVDTQSLKLLDTIPGLGNAKAPGLALDAAGKRVYTSNLLGEVVVVDTAAGKVAQRYRISAEQPMNIALDPGRSAPVRHRSGVGDDPQVPGQQHRRLCIEASRQARAGAGPQQRQGAGEHSGRGGYAGHPAGRAAQAPVRDQP